MPASTSTPRSIPLIAGASSGIGEALASVLAARAAPKWLVRRIGGALARRAGGA